MDGKMDNAVLDDIVNDIEAEFELGTDAHQVLAQFLASVCSADYVCPPICILAEKLQRHSLFLVFDCIIMLKNNKILEDEKSEIISWLESKQIALQLISDAGSDEEEESFSGDIDDYPSEDLEKRELRERIRSGEIADKLMQDEIMDLEDELNRLRGF